ncbi:hypothetical protein E3P77_04090 [Wallemia ichthyophaga]|nr:hypothetical protein E3P77_04090 [Wallemia ichthyophaga]
MSGRIKKGGLKIPPKLNNKARKPPGKPKQKETETDADHPLPTPPATQDAPQSIHQQGSNENIELSQPTPAIEQIGESQEINTGIATPAPTQQIQQPQQSQQSQRSQQSEQATGLPTPAPIQQPQLPQSSQQPQPSQQKQGPTPILPSRASSTLSFNQRFNHQQQEEKSQQPLNTRASQTPLQTRAVVTPTSSAAPLNTRAAQNPLQTRASQATRGTPAQGIEVGTSSQQETNLIEKENQTRANTRKNDGEEDDQLEEAEIKANNANLSARQLRTQKMRMKKRPIEEIWRDDPEAQPIDTSTYKMSDLIHDPGVGRLSSRVVDVTKKHAQMKKRRKEEKVRLRELNEEDLKQDAGDDGTGRRRTVEDEEKQRKERDETTRKKKEDKKAEKKRIKEQRKAEEGVEEVVDGDDNNESSSDDDEDDETNDQQGPQMRLVNGKLVIDEQSLLVDRSAHSRNDTSAYEVTEELDTDRFVNTNTWRGNGRGRQDRWTRLETEMFYDALSRFGTDFEMIAMLFKGRTRRVIKAKFSREEKYNSDLITQALKNRKPFDLIEYGKFIGVDLSGPPPEVRLPTPLPQGEDVQKKEEDADGAEEVVNPDEEEHHGRGRRVSVGSASSKRKQSRGPGGRDPENEEGAEVVGIVEGGQVVAA